MPIAAGSCASCSAVIDTYLAYTGGIAARAFSCSASYWPMLVHFSEPAFLPSPG